MNSEVTGEENAAAEQGEKCDAKVTGIEKLFADLGMCLLPPGTSPNAEAAAQQPVTDGQPVPEVHLHAGVSSFTHPTLLLYVPEERKEQQGPPALGFSSPPPLLWRGQPVLSSPRVFKGLPGIPLWG